MKLANRYSVGDGVSLDKKVESISFNKTSLTLAIGQSETLLAKISPAEASNKNITWSSSDKKIVTVINGKVEAKKKGTATVTAITEDGKKKTTCKVKVVDNINYAEVLFVNVHNTSKILSSLKNDDEHKNKGFTGGMSIIIKSYDNKYILIDTGNKNSEVAKSIYNNVKIDYMVLSHSHGDHVGNAIDLLQNKNISVSKVIMKKESKSSSIYNKVLKALKSKDDLIEPNEEGQKISVGKYLDIYLFNTLDIYKNKECHNGYALEYSAKSLERSKINGKYYYFDGSKYPNIKIKETSKYVTKHSNIVDGIDNYYYAYLTDYKRDCNPNGNSLATIINVKGDNSNNYMYFPADLENVGYDVIPTNGYYGNSATTIYPDMKSIKFSSKTGLFTGQVNNMNRIPSETITAQNIKKVLGSDIKNIKIYQAAHHGLNNAPDAINTLGLNRKNLIVVMPRSSDPSTRVSFDVARTYYYTLSKPKKYYDGDDKNGIKCYVNYLGTATCKSY